METVVVQPETSAISVEVNLSAAGSPGATGPGLPAGGIEFDIPEKASGADFATRWTKTPTVSGIRLNPAAPVLAPLQLGQMTWDTDNKTARLHVGSDGIEGLVFIDQLRNPSKNTSGRVVSKGEVLYLAGVDALTGLYQAAPMQANGAAENYMVLGLAAESIGVDAVGLIKYGGTISGLNTTGAAVSEAWVQGDLLYVHPTIAGALTKVRPAAPAQVIPIAAVLSVHATEGRIGVQTGMREDSRYGYFTDTTVQALVSSNTPTAVRFNTTGLAKGITVGNPTSRLVCGYAGVYNFRFSLQVDKASSNVSYVYIWARKNGVDIQNSASRISLSGNSLAVIAAWDFTVAMAAGDYFELMWGADSADVFLPYEPPSAWYPAIPSALMTVTQIPS